MFNLELKPNMSDEELDALAEQQLSQVNDLNYRKRAVRYAYNQYMMIYNDVEAIKAVQLSDADYQFLSNINHSPDNIIMEAFIRYAYVHPHKSNYIRINLPVVAMYTGLPQLKYSDLHSLTQYGFEVRVAGSKMALPTYLDLRTTYSEVNNASD